DYAMRYWRDQGAPPEKINMGLAAYGRAFNLSSASSNVGAPANGPGEEGCYTGEEGFWAYYEICLYLEGVTPRLITDHKVPYAITENQWVGFDNKDSLNTKVNYLKDNNFGGAFIWSLDLDDNSGQCCKTGKCALISHLHALLVPGFPDLSTTNTTSTGPKTTPTTITTTPAPPKTAPTTAAATTAAPTTVAPTTSAQTTATPTAAAPNS
ncbi:chitinase-3-like protein 2, partial [Epinephelus moara]|uniref:chitinase-3-like protein 2 n=1 Tax=Epinephelus moara TaxID=300413 RepID=UPI00214E3E0A